MKKILLSLVTVLALGSFVARATTAYFSDTETSNGNTFSAGTLNLKVDGNDGVNTVKWTLANLRPGNQPTGKFILENDGSISGYLDLKNIHVTSHENVILEPETEASDITTDEGELEDVLGMTMYWDKDCSGYYSTGDEYIYNGMASGIASAYNQNIPVPAQSQVCVMGVFNWWNTAIDNQAMSDSFDLDMTFELAQNL